MVCGPRLVASNGSWICVCRLVLCGGVAVRACCCLCLIMLLGIFLFWFGGLACRVGYSELLLWLVCGLFVFG